LRIFAACILTVFCSIVAMGQDNPYKAPLYWSVYEYCYSVDGAIPESEWLANIDWVDQNFKSYGYDMICIDGWGDDNEYNEYGYRKKHASEWTHDYAWWSAELQSRDMSLGMYYNPLWINRNAAASGTLIKGTDIPLSTLIDETEEALWFTWVQVDRPGAEEYVKGYVQYYADMGVKYLRVDFLSWFESGVDKGNTVGPERSLEHYETALRWMREACDANRMFLSLVMPNLYNEAATEVQFGHMVRINEDVASGAWSRFNNFERGIRHSTWSQYYNTFDGYTYWSHIAGRDSMILDGDFIRINTMANEEEKKTVISLHLMAGGPLSVADQYSSIGEDLWLYQNEEMLALNQDGFVGKPQSNNPLDKSSQIWTGQMSNGDWIVALFNREDQIEIRSLDLSHTLDIMGSVQIRDLWAHKDLGTMGSITASIPPHGCMIFKVIPGDNPLQAQFINFESIEDVENISVSPEIDLEASASSGLEVDFEIVYGPARVDGNKLTFTGGSGEVLVRARQNGNEEFGAAIPEIQNFYATDPVQTYENLYILGDATPVGWNIGSPDKMTQNETNSYVWEWEGELSAGEFKFSTYTGDWCDGKWINASQPNQSITATDYIITSGCDGPDNKWLVKASEAGAYSIAIDVENESIHITAQKEPEFERIYILGDATPAGWNIASPIAMNRDENNPFLFTKEVFLTPGELKFPTFTGDWCDGDWINASQANQSISATDYIITHECEGPDNKWKVLAGEVDEYLITINLEIESIQIKPTSTIGIDQEHLQSGFSVFPNPVSEQLNIVFEKESSALVTIYSTTGAVLYQEEVEGLQTSIDMNGLGATGIILVKISNEHYSELTRVVVQ